MVVNRVSLEDIQYCYLRRFWLSDSEPAIYFPSLVDYVAADNNRALVMSVDNCFPVARSPKLCTWHNI